MTPRDNLLAILRGRPADRPAVLCPGGMMSLAVTEVMRPATAWPLAHTDEDAMVGLALAMRQATGFDNLALPFCMTLECAAYGAAIDLGDLTTQPRVRRPLLALGGPGAPSEALELLPADFHAGRAATVLRAMRRLRAAGPDGALVGNLNGPFSVLGELIEFTTLLKLARRKPDVVRRLLSRVTDDLAGFAAMQIDAGAEIICIAEPSATGEILGGELFRALVLPCLNRLCGAVRERGAAAIVHICGDVRRIAAELRELSAYAVSFDSGVNLADLTATAPPWRPMGNVSPLLLESGPPQAIARQVRRLVADGVRLIAPACGIVPTTPVAHLRAMRDALTDA
jgi:MtaA/CmuA family methyltransferase